MRQAAKWVTGILLAGALCQALAAGTLENVKARGKVRCGVNGEAPGLSFKDSAGHWSGMDVDFCRAVAAATLGSKDKVEFIPLTVAEALDALAKGQVDLISRNSSWNLERDVAEGVTYVGVLLFDGQGFMIRRDTGILSALELDGKSVCALTGSTSADHVRRYFDRHHMDLELHLFPDMNAASKAYLAGDCQILTSDQTQLYGLRLVMENGGDQRVLPEVISKEPLSPAVREGDAQGTTTAPNARRGLGSPRAAARSCRRDRRQVQGSGMAACSARPCTSEGRIPSTNTLATEATTTSRTPLLVGSVAYARAGSAMYIFTMTVR